jgi:hypothetical protein
MDEESILATRLNKKIDDYLESRALIIETMIEEYLEKNHLYPHEIELVEQRGDPTIWFCRKRNA